MTIPLNVKTTNYELTPEISNLIEEKIGTLERFIDDAESDILCDVEVGKATEHHQSGEVYRAEINMTVSGQLYRAEATATTLQAAVDMAKDSLKRELRRSKKKSKSLMRRGSQRIKEMLRFGRGT